MLYIKIEKLSIEHNILQPLRRYLKLISVDILVITASRIISNQFDIILTGLNHGINENILFQITCSHQRDIIEITLISLVGTKL